MEEQLGSLDNTLEIEEALEIIPDLVDSDDEEEEHDGIELDGSWGWDTGKEISEDEEEEGESEWETTWRWEAGRIGESANNFLHASWEKARKIHRMADLEGKIYRTAAENLATLARTKRDFLKIAAVNVEDLAEGKIEKVKEEAIN